jgi:hypothetical protein
MVPSGGHTPSPERRSRHDAPRFPRVLRQSGAQCYTAALCASVVVFLLLGIRSDCTLVHHVGLLTCPDCMETPGASHGKTPCTPMHERHQVSDLATMSGAVDSPSHQDSAAVCAGSYSYSSPYIFGFEVLGLGDPPKPPPNVLGGFPFPIFLHAYGLSAKDFCNGARKGCSFITLRGQLSHLLRPWLTRGTLDSISRYPCTMAPRWTLNQSPVWGTPTLRGGAPFCIGVHYCVLHPLTHLQHPPLPARF